MSPLSITKTPMTLMSIKKTHVVNAGPRVNGSLFYYYYAKVRIAWTMTPIKAEV